SGRTGPLVPLARRRSRPDTGGRRAHRHRCHHRVAARHRRSGHRAAGHRRADDGVSPDDRDPDDRDPDDRGWSWTLIPATGWLSLSMSTIWWRPYDWPVGSGPGSVWPKSVWNCSPRRDPKPSWL